MRSVSLRAMIRGFAAGLDWAGIGRVVQRGARRRVGRAAGVVVAIALGLTPPGFAEVPPDGAAETLGPDAEAPGPDAETSAEASRDPGATTEKGEVVRPLPPHAPDWGPLTFLGDEIPPGESRSLRFESLDHFTAGLVTMRGVAPGPTLCVTAGVHGDELNGIAIARRLIDETDPAALAGTLIVVPIVNAYGFRNGSRYLPDRRDLNRYFPGNPRGSAAARIAYQFFEQVVRRCDSLVDLHTGSLNRANLPQIRTDLSVIDNLRLAWGFSIEHVIHNIGQPGTLRRAATDAGVATVLYEAGEPGRIDQEQIERGVAAIGATLGSLGMTQSGAVTPVVQRLYGRTQWVRSDASGIYVPFVELGDTVDVGQRVAEVTDPFSSEHVEIRTPVAGLVIGMALGQVVIPGFALLHIGIEAAPAPVLRSADGPPPPPGDDATPRKQSEADRLRAELADERPE
ncbi:succinylglutamate desuccinylase/aspartoacylase family protein [Myxococcota bacterium]|nr:succinylglutamate desuccinylase/aspartoacylase family protein [Myxococcota bacterium]